MRARRTLDIAAVRLGIIGKIEITVKRKRGGLFLSAFERCSKIRFIIIIIIIIIVVVVVVVFLFDKMIEVLNRRS